MGKITIYAVHSQKLNYKEEFYKALLLSDECKENNLILPLTEKYENMYAKDLVNSSDIIIVNLTDATLSVLIETNWALKMNKKILFLIKKNSKCNFLLNKYKKLAKLYNTSDEQKNIIDQFIKENLEEILNKNDEGIITFGSLN